MIEKCTRVKEKLLSTKELSGLMFEKFSKSVYKQEDEMKKDPVSTSKKALESNESKNIFPDNIDNIVISDYLGGSSSVRVGYFNNKYFAIKKARQLEGRNSSDEQLNKEQLIDEYIADSIYSEMGFNVANAKIYESGKYKVSEFIKGKNLNTFSGDEEEFKSIKKEIQKAFVLDCLLANWDVVGTAGRLGGDNIRITEDGSVYRIDNGGALRFRARGERKGDVFGSSVNELDSMRIRNVLFNDISDAQIKLQIDEISNNEDKIINIIINKSKELNLNSKETAELVIILKNRIRYLRNYFKEKKRSEIKDKGEYDSIVTNRYFEDWDELRLQGNPDIKEAIKENIKHAEKKNSFYYEDAASELGISVEEFKSKLQKKIEYLVEKSNFFRATHIVTLDKVLNIDQRFKSQFEAHTSNGFLYLGVRADGEKRMFGFEYDTDDRNYSKDKENRPIYGYFSDEENGAINLDGKNPPPNSVNHYGNITVKIKNSKALEKATITFQDSLDSLTKWPPTPARKPHFTSFEFHNNGYYVFLDSVHETCKTNYGNIYNETQFHAQLTIDDIESIHVSINNGLSNSDLEKVEKIFKKFKKMNPDTTIKLIKY